MLKFLKNMLGLNFSNQSEEPKAKFPKGSVTAQELDKRLKNDPEYLARKAQKEKELEEGRRQTKEAIQPIMQELRKFGIKSFRYSFQEYAPLKAEVIDVLLKWLPIIENRSDVQYILIVALGYSKEPYDGQALIKIFDQLNPTDTKDALIQFQIGNTIAQARPLHIKEWLKHTILRQDLPASVLAMFPLAVARLLDKEMALPLLYQAYPTVPLGIPVAFAEIGGEAELAFLLKERQLYKGELKKEFSDNIKQLKKRLHSSS